MKIQYQMQIKIADPKNYEKKIWASVRQTFGKKPYTYDTKEEAEKMLRICYGAALCSDEMRVINSLDVCFE